MSLHKAMTMVRRFNNLVTNGNFSNGTNGDTSWGASITNVNNELNLLASVQYGSLRIIGNYIAGNKYYVRSKVKATSNLVNLIMAKTSGYNQTVMSHSGSGNVELLSGIVTLNSPVNSPHVGIADNRASGWDTIYIDDIVAVNLTALGLDSMTKEWCDANIAPFIIY